ncbi:MAG: nuclear transport factor 2 family protein [Syntrophaceae bacterium]|nr:nuclear transport factor 2 family protein [Syntrophaceae bacterium]
MKKLVVAVFVVTLVFVVSAHAEESSSTRKMTPMSSGELDAPAVVKEVTDTFKQFIAAINRKDANAWAKYYSKDEFVYAVAGADIYDSRSAWVKTITSFFSKRARQNVEPQEVRITMLGPNLVLLTSKERAEMQLKNGQSNRSRHVFTLLWKKGKEGWKILYSHESWVDEPAK